MDPQVAKKIDQFFTQYPHRSYPKGQILVFADENPEYIFYLKKGKVRMYDVSYRGDEVIVNIFKQPAFFPMAWAINREPNKFFYKTEVQTELHIAPVAETLEFITTNPDVLLDLVSRVYRGMDGLFGKIVHLMSGTAKSRLIHELVIECRRFGRQRKDGSYVLDANELDIAARSGLSRETVSREIQKLKEQKLVGMERGGIVVKDLATLEKLLGMEL